MSRPVVPLLLLVVALAIGSGLPVRAARDLVTPPSRATGLEIVVVEAAGCIYCLIFRRDVAPLYSASKRAEAVPMRFSDVADVELRRISLKAPIDDVPTVLVVDRNREIGRVAGYVGPENFFHAINRLLARAGEWP